MNFRDRKYELFATGWEAPVLLLFFFYFTCLQFVAAFFYFLFLQSEQSLITKLHGRSVGIPIGYDP